MRVVEFGSFLHSYASSFSLVVSSASGLSVSGNALNCYPTCLFSIQTFSMPDSYSIWQCPWILRLNKKHILPLSVSPLILLHPVSAGHRRIVPFTSSNWKRIHYEPNALGSQIPVRFSRALPSIPLVLLGGLSRFSHCVCCAFFLYQCCDSLGYFHLLFPISFPSGTCMIWQVSLVTGAYISKTGLGSVFVPNVVGNSTLCNSFPV